MKKQLLFLLLSASALISANLSDIETLKTTFVQKITNNTSNTLVYQGKMYAKKKDNQALWIYEKPIKKKIYYKDGKIVIIEPDLEQATFARLKKIPNIITLLKKAKKISNNRFVTVFNGKKYLITTDKKFVKYIEYKDDMQNHVKISFINPVVNKAISDDLFIYHIPKGYDILKQ